MSTYASIYYHVVFATNRRAPMIEPSWRPELHAYLGGIANQLECKPICIGGVEDHVHMLLSLKGKHAIADIMREVKKVSSTWAIQNHFHGFSWQVGYGAFTFRHRDLSTLIPYVMNQEEHHRTVTSTDELLAILAEENVEYDPRFFI